MINLSPSLPSNTHSIVSFLMASLFIFYLSNWSNAWRKRCSINVLEWLSYNKWASGAVFVSIIGFKCWWLAEGPAIYSCKHAKLTATFQPSVGCSPTFCPIIYCWLLLSHLDLTSVSPSQRKPSWSANLQQHLLSVFHHTLFSFTAQPVSLSAISGSSICHCSQSECKCPESWSLVGLLHYCILVSSTVPDIW